MGVQNRRKLDSLSVVLSFVVLVSLLPIASISAQESECAPSGRQLEANELAAVYWGRSATGAEASAVVEIFERYGSMIDSGDIDQVVSVVTAEFDEAMGFSACSELFKGADASDGPEFMLTPLRVTTDDDGTWLAYIQRHYEDGSEGGYLDVFMVIAIEQSDGSLLLDFAHRDIQFTDGRFSDAESLYRDGIEP